MMETLDCFKEVLLTIFYLRLVKVFTYKHGWNSECILKFYATLYVSGDKMDSRTWVMECMTENHQVKCSATEFLDCLHFPRFDNEDHEIRMHHCDEVTDTELHMLIVPAKVGDVMERDPKPDDLKFKFQTFTTFWSKLSALSLELTAKGRSMVFFRIRCMQFHFGLSSMWKISSSAF